MICAGTPWPLQPFSDLSLPSDQPISVYRVPLWLAGKLELFGRPFQPKGPTSCCLFLRPDCFSTAFICSSVKPHTHKNTHTWNPTLNLKQPVSRLPFLLLKGNMMRLIDHHVVNHSKFVVVFSYISLCPPGESSLRMFFSYSSVPVAAPSSSKLLNLLLVHLRSFPPYSSGPHRQNKCFLWFCL